MSLIPTTPSVTKKGIQWLELLDVFSEAHTKHMLYTKFSLETPKNIE